MILCGDTTDIDGGGVRAGRGCPPQKEIGKWEERVGRVNNKCVTISDGS